MPSHIEGAKYFKQGQFQGRLKQLNLEQIPGCVSESKLKKTVVKTFLDNVYSVMITLHLSIYLSINLSIFGSLSSIFGKLSGEVSIL